MGLYAVWKLRTLSVTSPLEVTFTQSGNREGHVHPKGDSPTELHNKGTMKEPQDMQEQQPLFRMPRRVKTQEKSLQPQEFLSWTDSERPNIGNN